MMKMLLTKVSVLRLKEKQEERGTTALEEINLNKKMVIKNNVSGGNNE